MKHPYFQQQGPRSTGKEAFNLEWLDGHLEGFPNISPEDVQATLLCLTADSIALAIKNTALDIPEVYVCGGGSHNIRLMEQLAAQLAPAKLASTAVVGIDPDWVEAATFAWLASRTLNGLTGNSEVVTGAVGARVLGGVYWGGNQESR